MSDNNTSIQTFIKVKFVKGGVHRFPRATEPQFATGDKYDVSFLANDHFHYFHFTVWVSVSDLDREIEFIQFQRWCENLYTDGTLALDYKSCEMMCHDLYEEINAEFPGRIVKIEITEDDINGAYVEFTPNNISGHAPVPSYDNTEHYPNHTDEDEDEDGDEYEDEGVPAARPFGQLLDALDEQDPDIPACVVAAFVNKITGEVEPMRFVSSLDVDEFCEITGPAGHDTHELIEGTVLEIFLPSDTDSTFIH